MGDNRFVPAIQPFTMAPQTFSGKSGSTGGGKVSDSSLIIVGAIIEALVSKQILTEEDIFAAITNMQERAPRENGQAPNNPEGAGYPGAADTHRGMGAENGKMSPNRS